LPPHSEYSLTELGRSALPLLDELDAWGENLRPQMKKLFGEE
jgi:DNA-binding HxlR family transcriptional regulator